MGKYLNLTHCDCTKNAGTANGCAQAQCLDMAYEGVVCGNCGGCSQNRAFEQIFTPPGKNGYKGVCAEVQTATTEEERNTAKMMCSQGLFCRGKNLNKESCKFHCDTFPDDPKCKAARRLRGDVDAEAPEVTLDTQIDHDSIMAAYPPIHRSRWIDV